MTDDIDGSRGRARSSREELARREDIVSLEVQPGALSDPPAPLSDRRRDPGAPLAVVCRALTGPSGLRVEPRTSLSLAQHEVRVRVDACGVNYADVLIVKGQYQERPPLPFTPGAEVCGTVVERGDAVTAWQLGDRVVAVIPQGGFAELAVAEEASVFAVPQDVDAVQAAALPIAYGTAHGALVWRAALKVGETLLVLGAAGGVGLAAVEVGHALGARVIAAASSSERVDLALGRGADAGIDYSREDLRERIKSLTGGRGVDVVFDPVGGPLFDVALRSLAWKGRAVVIGFAGGGIPKIAANLLLVKNISVLGLYWGAYLRREPEAVRAQLAELFRWLVAGRLTPHVGATYPLEGAAEALLALEERRAIGKLVVVPRRRVS